LLPFLLATPKLAVTANSCPPASTGSPAIRSRSISANAASSAGVLRATGEGGVAISADLPDPPELILQMLERWRAGYRLVLASRTQRDDPWLTRFTSRIYWRLFREYAVANMPSRTVLRLRRKR